jgi:hypothetical protein
MILSGFCWAKLPPERAAIRGRWLLLHPKQMALNLVQSRRTHQQFLKRLRAEKRKLLRPVSRLTNEYLFQEK